MVSLGVHGVSNCKFHLKFTVADPFDRFVAVQSVVRAVRMTYVPAQTVKVMTIEKSVIRYSWQLRAGYWKLSGGSEAAQSVFEVSVDGMTYLEHDTEGQNDEVNNDVNH